MSNQQKVFSLIKSLMGQANILTIPRIFITLTDGDYPAALFISQALYWSDKSKCEDGFFYKSAKEWEEETSLSYYQVDRVCKVYPKWIEVKKKKVNGAPTNHYRINQEALVESIMKIIEIQETGKSDIQETGKSDIQETQKSEIQETENSLTKTTQKSPKINAEKFFAPNQDMRNLAKQRSSEIDLIFVPESLRPLAGMFVSLFGRAPSPGEKKHWLEAWHEQHDLGITVELVNEAFMHMTYEGLTIKSPKSITNIAFDILSKANLSKNGISTAKASEVY